MAYREKYLFTLTDELEKPRPGLHFFPGGQAEVTERMMGIVRGNVPFGRLYLNDTGTSDRPTSIIPEFQNAG